MENRDKKIIYYQDELNDDFAGISRSKKTIDDNYRYINKNALWRSLEFIAYRIIMTPIAYFYSRLKFHVKIKNRKVIKQVKNKGFFLFGNHTQAPGDGYFPTLVTFPTKPYVVVNPDSVAIRGTEQFMLMIGALPLPSTLHGMSNFIASIEQRIKENRCIMIYPEAHIWPYYNKIRPFKSVSFKYPIKMNSPSFAFTTVYKKRKYGKKPRIEIYVDGPFYPDKELKPKQQQDKLRNDIYNAMVNRANQSDYEYIQYIKKCD